LAYLAELHTQLLPILSAINLNNEGIRYYAGSVLKSQMFQPTVPNEKLIVQ